MTYVTLRALIYKVTKCSASEYNIVMRVKYKLDFSSPIALIKNDNDVQFLLDEYTHSRPHVYVSLENIK